MAILVVSDVHGSLFWKKAEKEREPGDQVVFLGDYFDRRGEGPFAKDQAENFLEICEYARNAPGTTLLLGNHDWQYLPWDPEGCSCRDEKNYRRYQKVLLDNIDLLNMTHTFVDEGMKIAFSHGGITNDFTRLAGAEKPDDLNAIWREKPELFNFRELGPNGEWANPYGDDVWQSPLWVRNRALEKDSLAGWAQVVGHTPVRDIASFEGAGGPIIMTCTLKEGVMRIGEHGPM